MVFERLVNDGLCKLLNGFNNREALAKVKFTIYDESDIHIFSGSIEGIIANNPCGEAGFGWDPIFIPKGYNKTWAEMTNNEKHATSMRKIALKKCQSFLTTD